MPEKKLPLSKRAIAWCYGIVAWGTLIALTFFVIASMFIPHFDEKLLRQYLNQ